MEFPSLETLAPYLEQISFGAIAGFASGYAFKKVGKLLALALGLLFIAIQLLSYYGFVTVNWLEVQERVNPLLTTESLNGFWQNLLSVLTYNITFAAAFIPGFIIGLRQG